MDRWAEFYIGVYPFLDDMIIKFFYYYAKRKFATVFKTRKKTVDTVLPINSPFMSGVGR